MTTKTRAAALGAAVAVLGVLTTTAVARNHQTSCMDGVDIKSSTAMIEVYCGPAAAVVHTPAVGRVVVKPGSCVRGIRGPGSWDLYLGKDKRGGAPWQLTLHVSKPTGSAKPGLTMKWKSTQWSAIGGIKLTLGAAGGSFSGTAVVRGKKASPARQPIRGTFTC